MAGDEKHREIFARTKEELEECGDVSVLSDMAILSLVGADMKDMVGVAGKMFSTLGEHNVNIEMISQGKSSSCPVTIAGPILTVL